MQTKKKNRQEVGIIIQVMVAGVADVSMCKQLYEELICVRYTFWTEVRDSPPPKGPDFQDRGHRSPGAVGCTCDVRMKIQK